MVARGRRFRTNFLNHLHLTVCIGPTQAVDHIESFISDCDRRTELAKKRLVETQEEISAEVAEKVRRLASMWVYLFESACVHA